MKKLSVLLLFPIVFATASALEAKPKLLKDVALAWRPTTTLGEKSSIELTGLFKVKLEVSLTDSRAQPNLIAENREDEEDDGILPVTTKDVVADWLETRVGEQLGAYGLNIVASGGDLVVEGEIRRFMVTETETYQADIGILVTVRDAQKKELWQGMVNGSAERFGRSYKLENYHESISDAVLEAVHSMLENEGFRKALKGN